MNCPMFVNFLRECQYKVGFLPLDTSQYCSSVKHRDCPFYRMIKKIGFACKYLKKCPAFEHFHAENFTEFVELAKNYCLSKENNLKCKRFAMREKGQTPTSDLMPDGSTLKNDDWSKGVAQT